MKQGKAYKFARLYRGPYRVVQMEQISVQLIVSLNRLRKCPSEISVPGENPIPVPEDVTTQTNEPACEPADRNNRELGLRAFCKGLEWQIQREYHLMIHPWWKTCQVLGRSQSTDNPRYSPRVMRRQGENGPDDCDADRLSRPKSHRAGKCDRLAVV